MEGSSHMLNWEQRTLLSELIHGLQAAKQLQLQLGAASSPELPPSSSRLTTEMNGILLDQIVSSYEKAILMLDGSLSSYFTQQRDLVTEKVEIAVVPVSNSGRIPESPPSGSPGSEDFLDGGSNFSSKKRKMLPRWTEQVRISPERGLEGPQDDFFSWRKYGQKDILGAKYPRSYYRCTFRNTKKCYATKQVQRSDGDPTIFDVTYRGTHTCSQTIPPPEKRDTIPNLTNVNYQNDLLDNLRTNLTVRTEELDVDGDAFSFPVTPPFYSYNSINGDYGCDSTVCHVECSGPSDFTGFISTNTSTGSSPIFDVDFRFDPTVEIETGFSTFLHDSR